MNASGQPASFQIDKELEIPSIPLVLIKIIQALDQDTSTAKQLEELIMHDPALSARILRLANSAFYSFRSRVKTISHAITLLGINLVTSLAIGINIFDTFIKGAKSEAALINQLWTHSCAVGVLARKVWMLKSSSQKETEFAFLCGLLHDFGKVVFFKTYPGKYGSIFASEKTESDKTISGLEEENYGVDHAVVGEMLAKQWGFPRELAGLIRKHHDPSEVGTPMVAAVMLADHLAKRFEIGYDGDHGLNSPVEIEEVLSKLSISEEQREQLEEFASQECVNIKQFYRIS
ncbi:MAG: HDOD domain-containing protein [Acidobacteria bacterium]|nr:HDOD domain-containing protein [Acidobacteriota bacterium]